MTEDSNKKNSSLLRIFFGSKIWLIKELKDDKQRLLTEIEQLKTENHTLREQLMDSFKYNSQTHQNNRNNMTSHDTPIDITPKKKKLSPTLTKIYKLTQKIDTFEELMVQSGYKETTLRQYLKRIRDRGWEIKL